MRDGQGEFLLEDKIYPISKDDLIIVNPHINHTEISRGNPPLSYFTVGVDGLSFSFNDQKEYRIFNCRKQSCFFTLMLCFKNWIINRKGTKKSADICLIF